jgi:alkylation response protein AidB-like acyl-CoA dehydrogenase
VDGIGFSMAAPVIHAFGSLAQKKRYLSAMVKGEEIWCQGFSEPDSGSDVSSLRTTATKSGNDYIIEGQKTWTSNAHNADMMFALVKVKRGASLMTGLTYILVDMKDPNVEVRPIITVDGEHRFNEVFLNKVRVPATNVVGEVGKGWKNARFLLKSERVLVSQSAATRKRLKAVKKAAAERIGGSLQADPVMYRKISQLEIELRALETTVLRTLFTQQANPGDPALDGLTNVLKLRGSELRQRVGDLIVEVMGDEGLILDQEANGRSHTQDQVQNLFDVTATLAGGSSEIQRNLIANIALGLSGR